MTGGTVRISRLYYGGGSGAGLRSLPLGSLRPANQIGRFDKDATGVTVVMPSGANDPQLLVDLGGPLVAPRPEPPWAWLCLVAVGAGLALFGFRGGFGVDLPTGAWTCVAGVALAALATLWPLHRTLDYPVWDEANYLGEGRSFWAHGGLGSVSDSPVYLLWYAGWTRIFEVLPVS
jgi:hypothetical protein